MTWIEIWPALWCQLKDASAPNLQALSKAMQMWHYNRTGELLSGRIRKGRPQAHRLSAPVRTRHSPTASRREWTRIVVQSHLFGGERGKHFFSFLQEMFRWTWALPCGPAPVRSLARSLDNPIFRTSQQSPLGIRCQGCQMAHWESVYSATWRKTLLSCICLVVRDQVSMGGVTPGVIDTCQERQPQGNCLAKPRRLLWA